MGILSNIKNLFKEGGALGRTTPEQEAAIRARQATETKTQKIVSVIPLALGASAISSAFSAGRIAVTKTIQAIAPKIIQAVTPKTLLGKIGGATAVVVGAPLLAESSKARDVVSQLPGQVTNLPTFGADVGSYIDNPSEEKLKKIAKENPLLLAAIAAAVVVAGGKALMIYNQWKQKELLGEIKDTLQNDVPQDVRPDVPQDSTPQLPVEKPTNNAVIPTNTATPTLPETISVSPTSVTRKRRSTRAKQPLNIIQKTNVMVNVGNKSYSVNRKVFKA
jgi:hypothetical protein